MSLARAENQITVAVPLTAPASDHNSRPGRDIRSTESKTLFHSLPSTLNMASPSNLAVVLCHGSYHTSAPYDPLLEALQARGIAAHCPQLPTSDLAKLNVGDVESPDFDLEPPSGGYPQGKEDAEIIIDVLKPLVEAGKDVLLVGHSSGGWTATQAAQPDLQAKVRKGKGQAGGIIGILYIGAFIIPVGESIFSFFQPKEGPAVVPPFVTFHVSQRQPCAEAIDGSNIHPDR